MRRKKGFTLIELLVVIAIIALLLAILIPVLSKAKTAAEEVVCKTNMHQYQIATQMFVQEHSQKFPDAHKILYKNTVDPRESSNGWSRGCRWHNEGMSIELYPEVAGPFWPFIESTKAGICPTFAKIAKRGGVDHGTTCTVKDYDPQFTYSMNWHLGGKRVASVRSPSETFIWAEENMWRLNGLANYVLNDNALWIDPPGGVRDNFASFHKISKGKLALQRSSNKYNGGVANVLLLDGSVTFLSPEVGYKYTGKGW